MLFSFRSTFLISAIFSTAFAAPQFRERSEESKTIDPPPLPTLSLPPPTGLSLKVIALGVGTQNYTCNSTTGTYSSNTAVAKLYDATKYLSKHPDKVSTLSHDRLAQVLEHDECEDDEDYSPHLKHIGNHYFEPGPPILPDFDLFKLDLFLEAKGVERVPAPDTQNDIDWVYLVDSEGGETKGLKAVYRVETAGGKAPETCSGTEKAFIPYAALYWFYD